MEGEREIGNDGIYVYSNFFFHNNYLSVGIRMNENLLGEVTLPISFFCLSS